MYNLWFLSEMMGPLHVRAGDQQRCHDADFIALSVPFLELSTYIVKSEWKLTNSFCLKILCESSANTDNSNVRIFMPALPCQRKPSRCILLTSHTVRLVAPRDLYVGRDGDFRISRLDDIQIRENSGIE